MGRKTELLPLPHDGFTQPTACSPVQLFLTEVLLFKARQLISQGLVLVLVVVYLGVEHFQPCCHRLWGADGEKPETDMGSRKSNIYYLNNAILKYMDVDKYDNEIENKCKYTTYIYKLTNDTHFRLPATFSLII